MREFLFLPSTSHVDLHADPVLFVGAKWCIENCESLGAKSGPIIIFGKSAGGCLAFATALKLIDEGRGGDVLGVAPCQPITIHPDVVPEELKSRYLSYDENAENTINTKKGMLAFMGKDFQAMSKKEYQF